MPWTTAPGHLLALLALILVSSPARVTAQEKPPPTIETEVEERDEEKGAEEPELDEEDEGLRQRLTEREDKRRPVDPFSVDLFGYPLVLQGEWDLSTGFLRRRVLDDEPGRKDRFLLEQEIEAEAFWSIGEPFSIFLQVRFIQEEDLLSNTPDSVSDYYVERGEMWIYSEDIFGTGLNFDIGSLDYEDDRRWWWDEDLDAVRVAYETDSLEIVVSAARELGSRRTDEDDVDREQERVMRWIGELGWDWHENHAIELFFLYANDHSETQRPGDIVRTEDEDDSDPRLSWWGARAIGVFDFGERGLLGYWFDGGLVRGSERLLEFEELAGGRSEVAERQRRDVSGWAIDVGLNWLLPQASEPRLFAGFAMGSGDSSPDSETDRSFRQTGLHANEAGFGGVERFQSYGVALDPELSNLRIFTAGVGFSLFRSSSIDLVYHYYRLVEPADSLRDSRLEFELNARDRDLGHGLDLVLAVEEWERLELEFIATAFRTGRAFGEDDGTLSYGGAFAVRYAF